MFAMVSPSHASDGVAEVILAMVRCRCQIILVMVLTSHVGDGSAEAT
jgi:hypothetical protein